MTHTVGCVKDSHGTDYLSRVGRDEADVCRESLDTESVNYIDPEEETRIRVDFLVGRSFLRWWGKDDLGSPILPGYPRSHGAP